MKVKKDLVNNSVHITLFEDIFKIFENAIAPAEKWQISFITHMTMDFYFNIEEICEIKKFDQAKILDIIKKGVFFEEQHYVLTKINEEKIFKSILLSIFNELKNSLAGDNYTQDLSERVEKITNIYMEFLVIMNQIKINLQPFYKRFEEAKTYFEDEYKNFYRDEGMGLEGKPKNSVRWLKFEEDLEIFRHVSDKMMEFLRDKLEREFSIENIKYDVANNLLKDTNLNETENFDLEKDFKNFLYNRNFTENKVRKVFLPLHNVVNKHMKSGNNIDLFGWKLFLTKIVQIGILAFIISDNSDSKSNRNSILKPAAGLTLGASLYAEYQMVTNKVNNNNFYSPSTLYEADIEAQKFGEVKEVMAGRLSTALVSFKEDIMRYIIYPEIFIYLEILTKDVSKEVANEIKNNSEDLNVNTENVCEKIVIVANEGNNQNQEYTQIIDAMYEDTERMLQRIRRLTEENERLRRSIASDTQTSNINNENLFTDNEENLNSGIYRGI